MNKKKRYINLHHIKEKKLILEDKYTDFFIKRYVRLLSNNISLNELNIDFILDVLNYYSIDEIKPIKN